MLIPPICLQELTYNYIVSSSKLPLIVIIVILLFTKTVKFHLRIITILFIFVSDFQSFLNNPDWVGVLEKG